MIEKYMIAQGVSLNLGLADSASLAGQKAPRIPGICLHRNGIIEALSLAFM